MNVGMSLIMRLRPAFRDAASSFVRVGRAEFRVLMEVWRVLLVLRGQRALDTAGAVCKLLWSA